MKISRENTLINLAIAWIFKEKEKGVPNEELYQVLEFAVWAKDILSPTKGKNYE